MLQQVIYHSMQLVGILFQNFLTMGIGTVDEDLDFIIDGGCHLLGIALGGLVVTADEHLTAVEIRHSTQLLAHAVAGYHILGKLRGTVDIAGSAGGDIPKEQGFRHTAAQQTHDLLVHLVTGHMAAVFLRLAPGKTQRLTTGNDGNLPDRIMVGQAIHSNRMTGFMDGGDLLILSKTDTAALFRTCHDLHHGFAQVIHGQHGAVVTGCHNGGFVQNIA